MSVPTNMPVAEVKCGRLQWAIPRDDYQLSLRFLNNDTHPLYDQAALDAAVVAERERIFGHIRGAMGYAEAGYDDVSWRLLASLVGPNVK